MKFKKSIALFLSLVMTCTLAMGSVAGAVDENELTPIEHVDLYEIADTLALGTQFSNKLERHSHGPTVTELPDGDLFAVWFSAAPSGERDTNECRILGARSSDGGDSWTKPFEVYNLSGIPSNNPVVYVDNNGRLWVFFCTILNGQWVSAIPRYIYADPDSYERNEGYTGNPDWHYPEPLYVLAGDSYEGEGRWDEETQTVVYDSGDKTHIRYVSAEVAAKMDPDEYVKVDALANPEDMKSEVIDTKYITDSFVVSIRNQVEKVVAYLEEEKPYDDEFVQRNDHVIQCVNEGYFRDADDPAGYKSEPSLKDGAIRRASGADNNMDLWNPAYRRMGWQTKNQPIEITVPAGEKLSNGKVATRDTNRMLLPLYSDSLALSIVAYTDDGGKTWGYSNPIAGLGNIQGTFVQKDDGTIYQYFRTGKLDGKNDRLDWKTPRAESHDYGITWENQYVEPYLRNDGGFGITKLSDGTWVMVHNQDPGTDLRSGTRKSVTLSYSKDEGESWQSIMLDTDRQKTGSVRTGADTGTGAYTNMGYQYPGIIQLNDGSLLAIYQNSDVDKGPNGEKDKIIRTAKIENLDALLEVELTLSKTSSVLKPGASETLSATETYQGNALEGDSLLYRTTTPSVATVSTDGVVTAQGEGVAKILVSSVKYGAMAECLYTVSNKDVAAAPAAPTLESKTATSITIEAVDGLEYRLNNGAWQTSNVFTGLSSGTAYRIYARVAATDTTLASEPSEALTVETNSSGSSSGGSSTASYVLTFNTDGGSALNSITKNAGATINLAGYVPTKAGYTFAGWYTDSKLTVKVTSIKLTGNMTVYAKWTQETETPFTDVAANAYYADAVLWATKNGITGGTSATTFSPDATCTRAQAVTFLWAAAGRPAPKSNEMTFTDVATDAYYRDAVLWAVENGITSGTSATTFSPDATCTRAQIVTFLWCAQKSPAASIANPFTDVADDAYYAGAVLWAAEESVTGGTSATTFSPNNDCTRAQIVTFLWKCMK